MQLITALILTPDLSTAYRGEFLAIYREVVEARPDLYSDMTGLANPDNPDDDFWENIRHIQVTILSIAH